MKSNHLFLNTANRREDQSNYATEVKKALCQGKTCIAHFLFDKEITIQKVEEMVKKKGINKITFKGVAESFVTDLEKKLIKRFPAKLFTLTKGESISTTIVITLKPLESEELAVA